MDSREVSKIVQVWGIFTSLANRNFISSEPIQVILRTSIIIFLGLSLDTKRGHIIYVPS